MKAKKAVVVGGLLLGLLGCSKGDYIKVTDVDYKLDSFKTEQTAISYETEFIDHVITVYRKGFDKDGISKVHYFLDGKNITTRIMGRKPGQSYRDVKELDKYPMKIRFHYKSFSTYIDREGKRIITPTTIWNDLKKGKHSIKVVLVDYDGNKVEDSYDFKVK